MDPKDLLVSTMSQLWAHVGTSDYIYFIIGVIVLVLVAKVLKFATKSVLKVGLVIVVIFVVKKFIGL